ncbi:MAG: transposase, partial [Lachnospiraceae bacterium]|nr:transposase [Lachnospiraceae bacterium]
MGQKDSRTKKYMSDSKRFADFFNAVLYNGRKVIQADDLTELDSTNVVLPFAAGKKSIALQKVRDIIKSCIIKKNNDMFFVLLGIENQSDIHYAMPVRQMLYNAMSYTMQVDSIAKEHWNNDDLL